MLGIPLRASCRGELSDDNVLQCSCGLVLANVGWHLGTSTLAPFPIQMHRLFKKRTEHARSLNVMRQAGRQAGVRNECWLYSARRQRKKKTEKPKKKRLRFCVHRFPSGTDKKRQCVQVRSDYNSYSPTAPRLFTSHCNAVMDVKTTCIWKVNVNENLV